MDWRQYFNLDSLLELALPLGLGLAVAIFLIVARFFLYRFVHRLSGKNRFGDTLVSKTRIASFLWCLWLGIYTGWRLTEIPDAWADISSTVIPILFVSLGIYTIIVILTGILTWYRSEICPRTCSSLDDVVMSILIVVIPVFGAILGVILILNMLDMGNETVNAWLQAHAGSLTLIVIISVLLLVSSIFLIPKIVLAIARSSRGAQSEDEIKKRVDTLIGVLVTSFQVIILTIMLFMILSEFGLNITPVLAGAGVVGIAVGFGAQSMIRDLIAGLFIIVENQYRKGDVARIADITGVVEEINLRRTILRDLDGVTHIVPNGEIRVSSNFTKQWSRANLNISVAYSTDLEKAMAVINRVGQEMTQDSYWAGALISAPKALRVDRFGDSGIEIKVLADTKPIRQWEVMGELRLRLKKAFDKEGIEIPLPHTKLYFGNQIPIQRSDTDHIQAKEDSQDKQV